MKESQAKSTESESSDKDTKHYRANRLKKYRDARKGKTTPTSTPTDENQPTPDTKPLSREEKLNIQKVRNRDAAQRARDKAKVHLDILEKQVADLKEQIKVLKEKDNLCSKCRGSIFQTQEEPMDEQFEPIRVESEEEGEESFFEKSDSNDCDPFVLFERVKGGKGMGFPMFITILTISLCIIGAGPSTLSSNHQIAVRRPHRLLQQIISLDESGFTNMKTRVYPVRDSVRHHHSKSLAVSPPSPLRKCRAQAYIDCNDTCYLQNSTITCVNNISNSTLNNSSSTKHLQTVEKTQNRNDVLFCELPRIYRYKGNQINQGKFLEGQFSVMIDGSRMKEIRVEEEGMVLSRGSDGGFYEVQVEVVSVKQVNRSTCVPGYYQY